MTRYESWGRTSRASHRVVRIDWRDANLPDCAGATMLPYGNGRSYGDSCLNDEGALIDARGLNRFMSFDANTGILRCEAGLLLSEMLTHVVPRGWFPPVTPGTQFVTLGGALANDVHGKNHHRVGSFGRHVRGFELLRSNGDRLQCSPAENFDWFSATIGGLGLTGLVTWVELQLKRVPGPWIKQQAVRFRNLAEYLDLAEESDEQFEYTVAWVDCLSTGARLGRGLLLRANHMESPFPRPRRKRKMPLSIPVELPFGLVGRYGLRLFNSAYYWRPRGRRGYQQVDYDTFFYPLDAVRSWNRIYGPKGFYQYQCVVPADRAQDALSDILTQIAAAGAGSFLAVLKTFGTLASPGMLSFPRPGVTLALDFPNRGPETLKLLDRIDTITMTAGGALYPAKDARMGSATFKKSFPRWREMQQFIDPRFSSSFWRRVIGSSN